VNVRYSCRGLVFEWDPDKAKANLRKHAVSFESACEVFFDPLVKIRDAGDPDGETDAAIGESQDEQLLFVVHVTSIRRSDSHHFGPCRNHAGEAGV
jgi:uncharacterized protein